MDETIDKTIYTQAEKNHNEEMVFEEQSTGRFLVVKATDKEFEFDSALYDRSLELISEKRIGTVFDDRNIGEFSKACDGAMEYHRMDKTDTMIFNEEEFEEMLNQRQRENMQPGEAEENKDFVPELKAFEQLDDYLKKELSTSVINNALFTPKEYLKNLLSKAGIEVIEDAGVMKTILDEGKRVQKMAVKYGTSHNIEGEESFNGFGTYVVSVNEENARQLGIKIASKKYGGTFYINGQPLNEFLQKKNFSPYWTSRLEQFSDHNVEYLADDFFRADVKGNPSLEKERDTLSTLFSLGLVDYKREQTFLYSVDIPDNDNANYLLYNNPIGIENANRINERLERMNVEWRVTRNDIGKNVYFNTLAEKVFGGNKERASEFLKEIGYVGMEMNSSNYIVFNDKDMKVTNRVQYMIDGENNIYGFAYDGKIYADPEISTSNTYAHEYTHLWDAYTQKTNPELWERGKNIFKGTSLWNEVMTDENYQNLSTDDEILSECHSRIVGRMAEKVLGRIAEKNGGLSRDKIVDWDKEVSEYIASELGADFPSPELENENYVSNSVRYEIAREFLSQPMKGLLEGKNITLEKSELYKENETEISAEQAATNFLLQKLSKAGVEVVSDNQTFENMLAYVNEVNICLEMLEEEPYPIQTMDEKDEGLEHDRQISSPPTSSKPSRKNFITSEKACQELSENFEKLKEMIKDSSPKEFLQQLKQTLGTDTSLNSNYVKRRIDEKQTELRVSDHFAHAYNARFADKTDSVVIKLTNNRFKPYKNSVLNEYVYRSENLTPEKKEQIIKGIQDWIQTGEYTDKNYDDFHVSPKERLQQNIAEQLTLGGIKKGVLTGIAALSLASAMPKLSAETNYDLSKAQTDGIVQVQSKNVGISYFRDDSGKKYMKIINYNEEEGGSNDLCIYLDVTEPEKTSVRLACNASDLFTQSVFEEKHNMQQTKKERERLYSSTADIPVEVYNSLRNDELFDVLNPSPKYWPEEHLARKASLLTGNGSYVAQKMIQDSLTYGFVLNNKIYLNPEVVNSNVIAHEYTHIWDKYTQAENPALWESGKNIFKRTNLWKEVVEDENYTSIKNNEDLVLSECHARVCGKFAQEVLNKIAAENGNEVREEVVNWDKEVERFIAKEFGMENPAAEMSSEEDYNRLKDFLSQPMKDLMAGRNIALEKERSELYHAAQQSKGFGNGPLQKMAVESERNNPQENATAEAQQNEENKTSLSSETDSVIQGKFQSENQEAFKALDDYLEQGTRPKNDEFVFPSVPEVLNAAGISPHEIVIKTSVINKAMKEHGLSAGEVREAVQNISNPVLIFNTDSASENKRKSVLALTDVFARNGKPVAFAMNLDENFMRGRTVLSVNQITSVHDRTLVAKNGTDLIQKWTNEGNCRYVDDKKISDWQLAAGVQFPLAVLQSDAHTILTKSDIVKQIYSDEKEGIQKMAIESENEVWEYIHSPEFIEKFGDWEKANRLEKLKGSQSLDIDNKIYIHGIDETKRINELRSNPSDENLRELSNLVTDMGKEMLKNLRVEQNLNNFAEPIIMVKDDEKKYRFNFSGIKEAGHHNLYQKGHIEGIFNIPMIVSNAIYIGKEKNEDNRKPELERFYYYALGIKLENADYTAKVVFTENKNGEIYYDQSLSTIEKGKFVDIIKNKPVAVNPINRRDSNELSDEHPSTYYDKRLYQICQVPQMPYLEQNKDGQWQPTKEAVEAVRNGELLIKKEGQTYKMLENPQENATDEAQQNEVWEYIHSPEFIEKFGDWEKANRLEKLKESQSLEGNKKIIRKGKDITSEVNSLREFYSRENLKKLQDIATDLGDEILANYRERQGLNQYQNPVFRNENTGKEFTFQTMGIKEIRHHNIFQFGHIEAMQSIPEIINKAVYIGEEKNEDNRNPFLERFYYYGCGIKIAGDDFTCKVVFTQTKDGQLFYDQSLSTIEKGRFLDIMQQKNKPDNSIPLTEGEKPGFDVKPEVFNPQQKGWDNSELYEENKNPFNYYDKRLIQICQVPQMPYLEQNKDGQWQPMKEAVEAVRNGDLMMKKEGQVYEMVGKFISDGKEAIQKMAVESERDNPQEKETAEAQQNEDEVMQDEERQTANPDDENQMNMNSTENALDKPDNDRQQDASQAAEESEKDKDALPAFALITRDGLKMFNGCKVQAFDSEEKKYIVANEKGDSIKIDGVTLDSIRNPKNSIEKEPEKNIETAQTQSAIVAGKTRVPEFAMITQNGLKEFKDMVVQKYSPNEKVWTLSNAEGEKVSVSENTFRELTSESQRNRAKEFDENTPAYKKMLETQYNDYFKQRENTASNFIHNLSVYSRKEANSPIDAIRLSSVIIKQMSPGEKQKTKELLKTLCKDGETINSLIANTYLEAVKDKPLNEEYILSGRYKDTIVRPMYDTISAKGEKVDKDFSLRVGDTVSNVSFKSKKMFGAGSERMVADWTVISASKEGNVITLKSGNSFKDVPRDTFLKQHSKQEKSEQKQQVKERKRNALKMDIER